MTAASMFDAFSETELLAYIEDELPSAERAALEARLDAAPRARALLERMRGDRALLRTAGAPDMPMDFLAAIEPQLARPMLIEAAPGAYRREHRRRHRRRVVRRASLAAAVLLVVTGGVWTALQRAPRPGPMAMNIAPADDAPPAPAASAATPSGPRASGRRSIHHERPLDLPPAPRRVVPGSDPAGPVLASVAFALVLEAETVPAAEHAIEHTLARLDAPSGAFVRHFNDAELRMIIAEVEHASRDGRVPDLITSMDGATRPRIEPRAWSLLAEPMRRVRETDDNVLVGRQLHGSKALSPDYGEQLELSRRGVTHTVTVRVDRLAELLAGVRVEAPSRLVLLPVAAEQDEAQTAAGPREWVADLHVMQAMIARIRAEHGGDAYVMLPVVVQAGR